MSREKDKYEEGLYHLNHGEYDEAVKLFQELLQEDAEDIAAMNKMGVAFIYQKKVEEAEKFFLQAIAIDNRFAAAYSNLGNIYLERGELGRAKELYQKALTYEPDYGPARNNLGIIYKREGNLGKAVQEFRKAQKSGSFVMGQSSKESFFLNKGCLIIFALLFMIVIIWVFLY